MSKKSKILVVLVSLMTIGLSFNQIRAAENVNIHLEGINVATNYSVDDVYVVYNDKEYESEAVVVDKYTNEVLETFSMEKDLPKGIQTRGGSYSHKTFTNTKTISSGIKWTTEIILDVYTEGSFGQINGVAGKIIYISSTISNMSNQDDVVAVSSNTGKYPTNIVNVSSATTLTCKTNSQIGAELIGLGFSYSQDNYYRLRSSNSFQLTYGYR